MAISPGFTRDDARGSGDERWKEKKFTLPLNRPSADAEGAAHFGDEDRQH